MTEIEDFVHDRGRLPRDSRTRRGNQVTADERRLARFLRYQRHNEVNLDDAQCRRLERLPGFEWTPIEDAWHARARAFNVFIQTHQSSPRRRSTDREERALATWFQRQLLRNRNGTLPHHLRDEFERLRAGVLGADNTRSCGRTTVQQ